MSQPLNTVKVFSIDEEKLKFRVTVSFAAPQLTQNQGEYKFTLPIPTSLANSHEYNSCLIDCKGFMAYALGGTADPAWTLPVGGMLKVGVVELQLDIPSSQTVTTTNVVAADSGVGNSRIGGYRELVFLDCRTVGDGNGNAALAGRSAAWYGSSESTSILCGNPFGQTLTIRNHDPFNDNRIWLVSFAAGANTADLGYYLYTFEITMVPNN